MFRRCVSLLVIAGLLAGQLAAMRHAHGAMSAEEQQEHDATPHVHCQWLGHADHDHGHHRHGHSHHKHQHSDGGGKKSSPADSHGGPLSSGASGAAHDADAIFLTSVPSSVSATSRWNQTATAWQIAALTALSLGQTDFESASRGSPQWHPPDAVLDGSETYLTLRNLRI